MIEIDGSIGGGQILRTVIGLSALTQEPVKITNIRTNRPGTKPGLQPQHLTGVKTIGKFCDAFISGMEQGSTMLQFTPRKLGAASTKIDIGTAGSVALLLQAITPMLIFSKKPISLEIIGGTEVNWSPTVQYYKNVAFPLLRSMGAQIDLEILKHGYYPKGGGVIRVDSNPIKRLKPWNCMNRGEVKGLYIDSACGSLPKDVAKRQGESAIRTLQYHYPKAKIFMTFKNSESFSPGSSCTCYAGCENSILGSSSLGERGLKAELVGQNAAEELVHSLERGACLDKYMADQILPFLALARGESNVSIEGATDHVVTNIHAIEKMLPVKFKVRNKEISVKGVGWE